MRASKSEIPTTTTRYAAISRLPEIEECQEWTEKPFDASKLPIGIIFLQKFTRKRLSFTFHKYLALITTFLAYMCYHASRRPLNVVKPILSPYDPTNASIANCDLIEEETELLQIHEGWDPFKGPSGEKRLVGLDFAFLVSYAIAIFFAGRIADRSNLRHFLLCGMLTSGIFVVAFGMGYFENIHSYAFYLVVQIATGIAQASGWPAVVAIVAQWFGKDNLGLVMGIWNSHTSFGNSLGSALSSSTVRQGWGTAFVAVGAFIAIAGCILWLFIVPQPSGVGYLSSDNISGHSQRLRKMESKKSITWIDALSIPGVLPFSIALFFSKFVAYTFLFWLPYYIASICIDGRQHSAREAGDFSILFDVGGILGGIFAGVLYDRTRSGGVISIVFGLCSIPLLLLYNHLGRQSLQWNIILLLLCGFAVNGPYALITTAVSATLGMHESIAGNERGLSTIAAIVDGMGSLGAALGPTVSGEIISRSVGGDSSFNKMFLLLAFASFLQATTLISIALNEFQSRKEKSNAVATKRSNVKPPF